MRWVFPPTDGDTSVLPNFASIFRNEPTLQTFSAGDILVREGDKNDKMFVILGGELEVRVGGKAGRETERRKRLRRAFHDRQGTGQR